MYYLTVFIKQESRQSLASSSVQDLTACNQNVVSSGGLTREKSTFKFTQLTGRIHFVVAIGLGSPLLEATHSSLSHDLPIGSSQSGYLILHDQKEISLLLSAKRDSYI